MTNNREHQNEKKKSFYSKKKKKICTKWINCLKKKNCYRQRTSQNTKQKQMSVWLLSHWKRLFWHIHTLNTHLIFSIKVVFWRISSARPSLASACYIRPCDKDAIWWARLCAVPMLGFFLGQEGGWRSPEEEQTMASAASKSDVTMKSGTQLHSSFSELFHTVKPTDSNECWLWPFCCRFGRRSSLRPSFFFLFVCLWRNKQSALSTKVLLGRSLSFAADAGWWC